MHSSPSYDILLIGSGMGSLSCAALLAKAGAKVLILEQNYLPGGCSSSYWRKGYTFESGATTLVGLDEGMPLRHVLDETGITFPMEILPNPMKITLRNGTSLIRYSKLEEWIQEAERVFGKKNQRKFWETCYEISQRVWKISGEQTSFPPERWVDLWGMALGFRLDQPLALPWAMLSVQDYMKKLELDKNTDFVDFVQEQLMITAQNHAPEVNMLFGATALCYTLSTNYYVPGGLLTMVEAFTNYIQKNGGELKLRHNVDRIEREGEGYKVYVGNEFFTSKYVVSGIPTKAFDEIFPQKKTRSNVSFSKLNSCIQMGIAFKSDASPTVLHHQIHAPTSWGLGSIFVSLHPSHDHARSDVAGHQVASVSTHWPLDRGMEIDKSLWKERFIELLETSGILKKEDIVYSHLSGPKDWEKWTKRPQGFVGGIPQFNHIKPWQMQGSRWDGHKCYVVGDSVYPGQGIVGVTLSGIIARKKMKLDWGI